MIFIGSLTWDGDLQEYCIHRGNTLIKCRCLNKNNKNKIYTSESWIIVVDGHIVFTSDNEGDALMQFLKIARE